MISGLDESVCIQHVDRVGAIGMDPCDSPLSGHIFLFSDFESAQKPRQQVVGEVALVDPMIRQTLKG
jgi:hypothetical protein